MKRISISIITLFLLTTIAFAAKDVKAAKILSVKAYEHGRIAYWEGRVPIYDNYPFYDITLSLAKKKYIVRYESRGGYYPSNWKVGSEIKVWVKDKAVMYLLNGEEDVQTEIVNQRANDCVLASGPPVGLQAGAQVPCE